MRLRFLGWIRQNDFVVVPSPLSVMRAPSAVTMLTFVPSLARMPSRMADGMARDVRITPESGPPLAFGPMTASVFSASARSGNVPSFFSSTTERRAASVASARASALSVISCAYFTSAQGCSNTPDRNLSRSMRRAAWIDVRLRHEAFASASGEPCGASIRQVGVHTGLERASAGVREIRLHEMQTLQVV